MKKLILLAMTAVMMAGCSEVKYTKHQTTTQDVGVFEYDSCEYITIYSSVSHKGTRLVSSGESEYNLRL